MIAARSHGSGDGAGGAVAEGDVVIRTATGNDLNGVLNVGHRTWLATYEPIAGPEYVAMGLAKWWTHDVVTASIRVGRTIVAVIGDTVIGVATFGVQSEQFVIWKLYVLPGYHGRGIGTRLMDAVLERARELGHGRVVLSRIDGNEQAAHFYAAKGFVDTHREPAGSGLPDSIWMARDLTDDEGGSEGAPKDVPDGSGEAAAHEEDQ